MEINHCKTTRAFDIQFKNPRYYLTLEKNYLGPLAQDSIQELSKTTNPPKTEIQNFRISCLNFFTEIISQIKDRFEFKDSIFNILSVLEPKEAQSFEKKDLSDILSRFSTLNTIIDEKALGREWREHALLEYEKYGLQSNLPAEEYWRKVFQLQKIAGGIMFPNLRKVFSLLFVLPFSNACVERVLSQLKLIKTVHRNNLHTSTISALMTTKENIKDAIKFEPNTSVLNRCKPCLRQKHLNQNTKQKNRVKLAVQLLSHTVAAGMFGKISQGELTADASVTADIISRMDKLFDTLNSDTVDLRRGKPFATNLKISF
ncbi:unnamed protein product, partial [Brenthis ino]